MTMEKKRRGGLVYECGPKGSRGKAPERGLGDQVPQKLKNIIVE